MIVLIMFLSILELFRNAEIKKVVTKALKAVAAVAIAVAVYYAVSILLCKIFGITMLEDKNAFVVEEGKVTNPISSKTLAARIAPLCAPETIDGAIKKPCNIILV